jgi:hypothetical protein
MNPEALTTIVARLEKLEKQNRRLKTAGIALLLLCSSAFLVAARPVQSAPSVLTAKKFTLVTAGGREIMSMTSDTSDQPGLQVLDVAGKERAWLGVFGKPGQTAEPGVAFFDTEGVERLWAGLSQGTAPRVIIYDKDHKETWSTPTR